MRATSREMPLEASIRVELQQADRVIAGTWLVPPPNVDVKGEIRGTLEGIGAETTFRGVITWNSETSTGTGRCLGTATFTGPAVPPSLSWTSPGWDFGATCNGAPLNVTWSLVR